MIIKTNPDEIENYSIDASNFKGFCDAVYFPENAKEVSEILKECNGKKTPVTISGNGTGLTGARVPQGGIVLSTEKLNKIIEINKENNYVITEPGVVLSDLQKILKEKKMFYPPDPTEKNCFIGGTICTNASGEKTFKYGPTRNYVLEFEIILPDGDFLTLKRSENKAVNNYLKIKSNSGKLYEITLPEIKMPGTKNAAGYFIKPNMDAIDLFIGSEGTLGVITKVKLKTLPFPEEILSCVLFFDDENNALSFINKARDISFTTRKNNSKNTIDALALEFFENNSLKFLQDDYKNIPKNAKGAVWFEQEVISSNKEILFEQWLNLISEFNGNEETAWFAFSDSDKQKIQDFRHLIPAKVNEYISKNNFRKIGTDAAVPDDKFDEYFFYAKNEIEKEKINYVGFGHAGNSHIHINLLPKDEIEFAKSKIIYDKIVKKAISLRGTVSAEHGIGKLKTEYLLEMYGEKNIKSMAGIKKLFDPNWILGKGNIFSFELHS